LDQRISLLENEVTVIKRRMDQIEARQN